MVFVAEMKKVEEPKIDLDDSNDLGSILSGTTFDSLEGRVRYSISIDWLERVVKQLNECLVQVSSETLSTLKDMGFTKMTEIQAKSIGPLLEVSEGWEMKRVEVSGIVISEILVWSCVLKKWNG